MHAHYRKLENREKGKEGNKKHVDCFTHNLFV